MVSNGNAADFSQLQIELPSTMIPDGYESNAKDGLSFSTSQKTIIPTRLMFLRDSTSTSTGRLSSPTAKLRQLAEEKDKISRTIPSSPTHGFRQRFNGILAQTVNWASMCKICIGWTMNPLNMALLLWITCVAISGAILFLVMTGMLNNALPNKSQRNAWFEANNQILNALFTLMCLYQHPKRFHHLILLCRWKPKDISTLRKIYCKNGTYKPHEWAHIMVVVTLLHVNCFAQYALCGLNLGYKRSERPAVGVGICLSIAIAAPAIAGVYSIVSPLGKEYDIDSEVDIESEDHILNDGANYSSQRRKSLEKRFSFATRSEHRVVEYAPVWRGSLYDFWDDIAVACLSLFCCFCVFGWNMDRLGFGNMYVHIATFLLFCMAPFWIFNLAAINIDNETVREAMGLTGIILCVFGLLYGGFWRIQMRKRFNLPANHSCCGKPAVADCAQWLFCCWCSLVQEVRTADFYDVVEEKFCRKQTDENGRLPQIPLPCENGVVQTPLWNIPRLSGHGTVESKSQKNCSQEAKDSSFAKLDKDFSSKVDRFMKPPATQSIHREDNTNQEI
ncbi:hypothetical protein REPUB_Repub06bG0220300 [Reevesia pubescens]